ncbi:MAG TPA: hypothetical protein VK201_04870 [bacterium]|jgi:hypothetical protein|nr:hypothetical protein [bacterium]
MGRIFESLKAQIREVNRRYATPAMTMTPLVKFCLVSLRVYLLVLVTLMIVKFILVARQAL